MQRLQLRGVERAMRRPHLLLVLATLLLLTGLKVHRDTCPHLFKVSAVTDADVKTKINSNNIDLSWGMFPREQIPSPRLGYNRTIKLQQTTCGPAAYKRGPGQKVVAFTFFGILNHSLSYFQGISSNLEQMKEFYPGWIMRLYHDHFADDPGMEHLNSLTQQYTNFDLCDTRNIPGYGNISDKYPLIWRFLPIADAMVDVFVSRDLDSRFSDREAAAVKEWLNSTFAFHIMRDHPGHATAILGGMWGVKINNHRSQLRAAMNKMLVSHEGNITARDMKGPDQVVLWYYIWNLAKDDALSHDSYLCELFLNTSPWPTRRKEEPRNFVGSLGNMIIWETCPKKCRPKQHQDWLQC